MFGRLRRLFEKRSTLAQPASWLSEALGALPTASGATVSPDKALTLSAYWAATNRISSDLAAMPLLLYRRTDSGKERATKHPLYHLLRNEINPEQSSQSWREAMQANCFGWGNAYSEITRDARGRVTALWPIHPSKVRVERDKATKEIRYIVQPGDGGEVVLLPENMFHLKNVSPDGILGWSIAKLARESLGLSLSLERHGATFFGNGARPGGILQHPGQPKGLSDVAQANMRESWNRIHGGANNAHEIAILQEGTTYQQISLPNEDSQFLESRQFQVQEIARWFSIPPHLLGDLSRATFSNISEMSATYLRFTLQPWIVRWETEVARKLLPKGGTLFAEHLTQSLLRGTTRERFDAYAVAVTSGWLSRNEVRKAESLNELPGLDTMLQPLNHTEVGGDTQAAQSE